MTSAEPSPLAMSCRALVAALLLLLQLTAPVRALDALANPAPAICRADGSKEPEQAHGVPCVLCPASTLPLVLGDGPPHVPLPRIAYTPGVSWPAMRGAAAQPWWPAAQPRGPPVSV